MPPVGFKPTILTGKRLQNYAVDRAATGTGDYCYIIIIIITFMQAVNNYIPQTNHVSEVYSVAAILYLQFVLHVMLIRM
jgi:hypothetical protein